jgi:hypothetical protein
MGVEGNWNLPAVPAVHVKIKIDLKKETYAKPQPQSKDNDYDSICENKVLVHCTTFLQKSFSRDIIIDKLKFSVFICPKLKGSFVFPKTTN